jgi:hypothetical protein
MQAVTTIGLDIANRFFKSTELTIGFKFEDEPTMS